MFGDKLNEYDAVIPFFYINGKWKYSIFSNKDNIDCSQVAKTYDGGGHKGAAGWITDKLIFEELYYNPCEQYQTNQTTCFGHRHIA